MRHSFRADDAGPNDKVTDASPLVDGLLALLEEAGVPTPINDQIVKLVEDWEHSQEIPEPGPYHCLACGRTVEMAYGDEFPRDDERCSHQWERSDRSYPRPIYEADTGKILGTWIAPGQYVPRKENTQ